MADLNNEDQKNEWVDAVLKLIEFTQKKRLSWQTFPLAEVPKIGRDKEKVVIAFQSKLIGKVHLLTQHSYSYPISPMLRNLYGGSSEGRSTITVLRFIGEDGSVIFTVPSVDALDHLLKEVRYQMTDVRGYLDELLKSNST